jgi:hypothetical protein
MVSASPFENTLALSLRWQTNAATSPSKLGMLSALMNPGTAPEGSFSSAIFQPPFAPTGTDCFRIELDVTAGDGGEPDVAIFVGDEPVRTGIGCRQRIFLKFSGLRIESTQLVRPLPGVPKRAVRRECWIVRPRLRRRHLVFLDLYVQHSHRRGASKRCGWREQAQFRLVNACT